MFLDGQFKCCSHVPFRGKKQAMKSMKAMKAFAIAHMQQCCGCPSLTDSPKIAIECWGSLELYAIICKLCMLMIFGVAGNEVDEGDEEGG